MQKTDLNWFRLQPTYNLWNLDKWMGSEYWLVHGDSYFKAYEIIPI